MSALQVYLFVVVGVAISIVLPILRKGLPTPSGGPAGLGALGSRLWAAARPYVFTALVSLIAGILVVAVSGNTLKNWGAAVLAGYAWDSTVQKIKG